MDAIKESKEQKCIELISKIISSRLLEKSLLCKVFNEIFSYYEREFKEQIATLDIGDKSLLFNEISIILQQLERLTIYPSLAFQDVVAIYDLSDKVSKDLCKHLKISVEKLNSQCITYLLPSHRKPFTLNKKGVNEIEITDKEYEQINDVLGNSSIDLGKLIKSFAIESKLLPKQIAMVYIPNTILLKNETILDENLRPNTILVFIDKMDKDTKKKLKNIQLVAEGSKSKVKAFIDLQSLSTQDIEVITNVFGNIELDQFDAFELDYFNNSSFINNWVYKHKILNLKYKLEFLLNSKIWEYKQKTKLLLSDIIRVNENANLLENFKCKRQSLEELKKNKNGEIQVLEETFTNFLKKLEPLEQHIIKLGSSKSYSCLNKNVYDIISSNAYYSILNHKFLEGEKNLELVKQYTNEADEDDVANLMGLRVLLNLEQGKKVNYRKLINLKGESEYKNRCIIRLNKELKIDESLLLEIVKKLPSFDNKDELLYKAIGLYKERIYNVAVEYIVEAISKGSDLAKEEYLKWGLDNHSPVALKDVADFGIAKANLYMAKHEARLGMAMARIERYLKIASSELVFEAVEWLANYNFIHIYKYRCNHVISTVFDYPDYMSNKLEATILLYKQLLDNNCGNSYQCQLYLGILYYWNFSYKNAIELLKALPHEMAYFLCGVMYEFGGNGILIDLYKAKSFYNTANEQGHPLARQAYYRVKNKIDKVENRKRRNPPKGNNKEVYNKKKSYKKVISKENEKTQSSCFITNSIFFNVSEDDNCQELEVLRKYRDYMSSVNSHVKILFEDYYLFSPKIIKKLIQKNNPVIEYQNIWENHIKKAYIQILNNQYNEALQSYINMIEVLADEYGEPLPYSVRKNIFFLRG